MLSELKTSFLIGFQIYLPFMVLDIVIASVMISMGMLMLPPVLISLPFKLLLFVLVDGWQPGGGNVAGELPAPLTCAQPSAPRTRTWTQDAVDLAREAIMSALLSARRCCWPAWWWAVVGLLQAVTQIQEQTIAFVPKLVAMVLTIALRSVADQSDGAILAGL